MVRNMKMIDGQQDRRAFRSDRVTIIIAGVTLAFGCAIIWRQWSIITTPVLAEALIGLVFMAAVSATDIRSGLIGNKLLLTMLCAWALLQMIAVATGDSIEVFARLITGLLGGGFGLFVFLVVYIATKRQLGGGDVKLAAVMGLYLTGERVLGAVLYGLIICAVYSGVMMLLKKLRAKDTVPLAPFLAIGYAISFLFVF